MKIVVVTAPSGAGKTTLCRRVLQAFPAMRFSVSATTRPMRDYEQDGIHYHFLTEEAFREKIAEGAFLEYEEVYPGRFYGTLRSAVEEAAQHHPVLLDIEVRGATNVKRIYGDQALALFIKPPSLDVLEERLGMRGTETPETLAERIDLARWEIEQAPNFDHTVVNDDLEVAAAETLNLVDSFLRSAPLQEPTI